MIPTLFVIKDGRATPTVTSGLEFVLHGEREGRNGVWEPVRAFEVIAGELGRVKDGRLQRWFGSDVHGDVYGDIDSFSPCYAPWREAWDEYQITHTQHYGRKPDDGPVWLVGPSVMGNFYGLTRHELRRERELWVQHKWPTAALELLAQIKTMFSIENALFGIEWRLGDEPVARVLREEMGL